jgi:long-subunit acyl-CoA synthetase (AMP-forming)
MASSTQQTIKQESSASSFSNTNDIKTPPTTTTTIKEEYSATMKPEDETFEQFYSEVNDHISSIDIFADCFYFLCRSKQLKNVILS